MSVCHHDVARQHRHRRAAGNHGLELAARRACRRPSPAASRTACPAALRSCPGLLTWPDTENSLVPPLFGLPELQEASPPLHDDPGHRGEGLGVVDRGRLAVQAEARRERRLEARLALLAFEGFEQRGFFAADVGAVAVVRVQVEVEIRAQDVLAEIAGGARFLAAPPRSARRLPRSRRGCSCSPPSRPSRSRRWPCLRSRVRVVAQDVAVLEGARLAFVGIADEVLLRRGIARHEAPLQAGRESPRRRARAAPDFLTSAMTCLGRDLLGEDLASAPRSRRAPRSPSDASSGRRGPSDHGVRAEHVRRDRRDAGRVICSVPRATGRASRAS